MGRLAIRQLRMDSQLAKKIADCDQLGLHVAEWARYCPLVGNITTEARLQTSQRMPSESIRMEWTTICDVEGMKLSHMYIL